ncbi:MAG TPA: ribbon-helix-helix protein, CopG family [Candidatus Bathyarchaeota archaeon]|nr:ribbon-helix-helix protein, CopG family [Candidatus Bathyarchaeota archaeon]HEX69003.1 ribbon-helix-helix protein, CopG family [Candidatus Bathyarchaeota archaeon]
MAKGDLVNLNVRVPRALKELIQKIVEYKLHANISEFARDALREKIQRDAPELYRKFYEEVGE